MDIVFDSGSVVFAFFSLNLALSRGSFGLRPLSFLPMACSFAARSAR